MNLDDVTVAADRLSTIADADAAETLSGGTTVRVADGSVLRTESARTDNDSLVVDTAAGQAALPLASVTSVRFRPADPAVDAAWRGFIEREAAGDRLVIRRDGGRLDVVEGVIESIDADVVRFAIDGQTVAAPLARLEGVLPSQSRLGDTPAIVVTLVDGSRLAAASLTTADDGSLSIRDGVLDAVPAGVWRSINFGGSSVPLVVSGAIESSVAFRVSPGLPEGMAERFFLNDAAGGRLPPGTRLTFRVPDGMRRLVGSWRRPDGQTAVGDVRIVITADGDERFAETFSGEDPIGFDVDVEGVGRLTIATGPADDGDLGDAIEMVRPRFIR